MSTSTPVMSSSPLARHWQWLSLRFRRTRRGLPSVLVIIFLIALCSIFFFPDLDVGSFAPRAIPEESTTVNADLLLQEQDQVDWRSGKKEPGLVDPDPVAESVHNEASGGEGLDKDDPLIESIERLRTSLKENYVVDYWRSARGENDAALERLSGCMQDGSCGEGERNVVLLATFHFGHAKLGMVSGEDIWARSSLEAFTALNYTLLYTYGHMDTLLIYQHIPDLVKTIIWEGQQLRRCMERDDTHYNATHFEGDEMVHTPGTWQEKEGMKKGCIKTKGYPEGIPLSKSFWFHFWPTAPHPLGEKWTLSPYDYWESNKMENFYLGYSIETGCEKIPFTKDKSHRAIVLGKRPEYFTKEKLAWHDLLPTISSNIAPALVSRPDGEQSEGFKFVGAYTKDKNSEVIEKQGVETLGKLTMEGWFEAVGRSKVMLGIGEPYLSPSPFDGLCQGVPFINVIRHWDEKRPEDRTKWRTQHDPLLALGAPYVYHVRRGDKDGLEEAIQEAIDHPIDRYIPPPMTRQSVIDKHRKFVETDWTALGKTRIEVELEDEDRPFPYAA